MPYGKGTYGNQVGRPKKKVPMGKKKPVKMARKKPMGKRKRK
jgi:hypothetical protein